MKVLLLSVKAGYGHHSTAKAIMEYFEENSKNVRYVFLPNRLPALL